MVDEILLKEIQKLSAVREAPEFLDPDYDVNDLDLVERMSTEETKEKLEWHKREFEWKQKNTYAIENQNDMMHIHEK